jgi:Bacteriophage probable baseplate hub protein
LTDKITPKFELLLEGSPVDAAVMESIIVIRARQHLNLADALEVRISNDDLSWTESDTFAEGKKLAVKFGYEETCLEQVVQGEIVRRECEFPVSGPAVVTVLAYDNEHQLKKGVHSRVFLDMKDSDIVSQLAGEAGLSATCDATSTKHRYVFQNAQTNLSLIRERAMLINYEVQIDQQNAKLFFRKAKTADGEVATLKWGDNLLSFNPRMTTDEQVSKVVVRGWDMVKKEKIEATADKGKVDYNLDGADEGIKLAEGAFKSREVLYTDRPMFEAGEADAMAAAYMNQRAMRFCEGKGSCQGDPKIVPGAKIKIEAVGERASGAYYVSETLHFFEPKFGYSTFFDFLKASEKTAGEPYEAPKDAPPPREPQDVEEEHWLEITVSDDSGGSLKDVEYTLTMPDGTTKTGKLDEKQKIRVEGIKDPADAKIKLKPPEEVQPLQGS